MPCAPAVPKLPPGRLLQAKLCSAALPQAVASFLQKNDVLRSLCGRCHVEALIHFRCFPRFESLGRGRMPCDPFEVSILWPPFPSTQHYPPQWPFYSQILL